MIVQNDLTLMEKLHILSDAAKYDVACTSSGVDRRGKKGYLGNSCAAGICHSFASDGRCISLLKVLQTNHCVYDCKYCVNRAGNDVPRTAFTPGELCELTIEFYKRNYIEGLFLSSGVNKSPAYAMEQMIETLRLLRTKYRFNGYVHVKAIPGASEELIAEAGYLADRMSINLELPTGDSLRKLAPHKTHSSILKPMGLMSRAIAVNRLSLGKSEKMERHGINRYLENSIYTNHTVDGFISETNVQNLSGSQSSSEKTPCLTLGNAAPSKVQNPFSQSVLGLKEQLSPAIMRQVEGRAFTAAGQSTQMIIGATPETDYHLIKTSQFLYQKYDLKRVFYSAYVPINEDPALPAPGTPTPLLREHRLYQADWLLRYYGFQADELLSEKRPNFNEELDPKCDWALRHLEQFPVEINKAPMDVLLRIPGVGPKSAMRIVEARRYGKVDFEHLKKMGVVLKRAHYFITCSGKMMYPIRIDERYITGQLAMSNQKENWETAHQQTYYQMSLFNDYGVG